MGFCKNLAAPCFNGNVWVFVARLGILLFVWVFAVWFGFLLLVFRRPSDSASSPSPRSAPSIGSSRSSDSVAAYGFLGWV
ncbi:hypothetical protein FH972_010580 [Carpinus fangiana]|uniref:Transmembrane protein n=1 Tax=Carpinus fangiana TaxID=176857 RepID=A0A660KQG8_9ROSI|nr:hypothetical protein FH972_010580 [Carpinus fangiana]